MVRVYHLWLDVGYGQADIFSFYDGADVSVAQWLGLTPPQVVKDTLHLPDAVIEKLPKIKEYIVPGNTNLLTTNFTREGP